VPFQIAIGPNIRKSPFFDATVADGVASFSVYNHMFIPAHFGDPEGEYDRLIHGVAMWDVAVQRQVQLKGPDAGELAQYLTARDIRDTQPGQGKYVPLCDHDGRLINDPVLLKHAVDKYWLSIADSDIALWASAIAAERGFDVQVSEPDVSPLAVQGPKAADVVADIFGDWVHDLEYFCFREAELDGIPLIVARSGWSKQGGFELYLQDALRGTDLWNHVKTTGLPYDIGPGAPNDVERIESGLLSYGTDADKHANPLELGLGKFVDLECEDDFVGKAALKEVVAEGIKRRRVGLFLSGGRISQNAHPCPVCLDGNKVGTMSECVFSPRLKKNIALALIEADISDGQNGLTVDIGNDPRKAKISALPFC
jgi:aminomethyltransferase